MMVTFFYQKSFGKYNNMIIIKTKNGHSFRFDMDMTFKFIVGFVKPVKKSESIELAIEQKMKLYFCRI